MNAARHQHSKLRTAAKWTGMILGTILSIIAVIFIGYMLYFLWQIKFGDPERVQEMTRQFTRNSQFTQSPGNAAGIIDTVKDYESLIHDHNPVLGPKQAAVTIIEFIDFECPFCQQSYPIMKDVIDTYDSAIRVIFKHTPLAAIHANAVPAAIASACAAEQNAFWNYHDALFIEKNLDNESLTATAERLGLIMEQFNTCRDRQTYRGNIEEDLRDAARIGFRGTPTYLINGVPFEGVIPRDMWDNIILRALKENDT